MKTILVIDADNRTRENTCNFLKDKGYNVISADNGVTGLQLAISYLPDIILCEIIMPGMNGYDFYKNIQQIKTTCTIPLIFLTEQSGRKDFRTAMNLGVDDYITKPVDEIELLHSIKIRLSKVEKYQKNNDKKIHMLIDNPLTGIFIYSNNRFTFVNEKCAEIFGISQSDFSNITFNDLVIGSDKRIVMKKIEHYFDNTQDTLRTRFTARCFDKRQSVVVEMHANFVYYNGVDSLVGYLSEYNEADTPAMPADKKETSNNCIC
jgi:PAS domain S-box-containing protein